MTLRIIMALSVVLAATSFAHQGGQPSSIEERYIELHRIERSTATLSESDQANAIARSYRELFSAIATDDFLEDASPGDLEFALRASHFAAAYVENDSHLTDMQSVYAEIGRRGSPRHEQAESMFKMLVAYRQFEDARHLLSQVPELRSESLPAVSKMSAGHHGYNAFEISEGEYELTPVEIDISSGTHLVVVSHPFCSFSRNARRDLEGDPAFNFVFSSQSTWLAPVSGRLNFHEIRDWNISYPLAKIVLPFSRSSWSFIDQWATPQFYALRDGEVIGRVSGWPEEGRKRELAVLISELQKGRAEEVSR